MIFGALSTCLLTLPGAASAKSESGITVGAGAAVFPTYQGSDEYRVLPFPILDVQLGQFFLNSSDGLGVNVIDTELITVGGAVSFLPGYRRRDVPEGIDRVKNTAGARLFTKLHLGNIGVSVGATRAIGGTKGIIADASLSYAARLSSQLTLSPSIGTSWANGKYMDRYFGISREEAIASKLPYFEAKGGFKDVTAALGASYRLSRNLTVIANAGVTRLLNDAADSPLNKRRWNPSSFVGIAYRF